MSFGQWRHPRLRASTQVNSLLTDKRKPVVLVHGIWNTVRAFGKFSRRLEQAGFEAHAWNAKPNNGSASLVKLAEQLAERIDGALGQERAFSLVGFSMGGVVSQIYLQRFGGARRVRKFVSIAAPHHGTFWARFSKKPGIAEMRSDSELLAGLNRDLSELARLPCLSLYTPYDLMILPARSSELGLGQVRKVSVALHHLMLSDRRVMRATVEFLKGEGSD